MNRYTLGLLCWLLFACVSDGDYRPIPYLNAEHLVRKGLEAYQKDHFREAGEKFNEAFVLYQSFDNTQGCVLSLLNLLETALAIHDFSRAQQTIGLLATYPIEGEFKDKLAILETKLAFQQQHYSLGLQKLQPLFAQLPPQTPPTAQMLSLYAMQAELELLNNPSNASQGLKRFQAALQTLPEPSPYYQAALYRLLGLEAMLQQQFSSAKIWLEKALNYYQIRAQRRAIADCLEILARVALTQHQTQQAKQHLEKGLAIYVWLKDAYKIQLIQQQIAALK